MKHLYLDQYCDVNSPITRLDPRIKILSFMTAVIFIILTKQASFSALFLYGLLILALILLSKVPAAFILKRSIAIIPFVLLVGALNLTLSNKGMMVFLNVTAKAYLSILYLIVLIATTPFPDLLKAFEELKCPRLITTILSFMYRYVFVIEDELMKLNQAKESRSVGGSNLFHAKALSNMTGVLFIRSYERAEAVYLAMCSRGFDGNIRTLNGFKLRPYDLVFFCVIISLLLGIRMAGN